MSATLTSNSGDQQFVIKFCAYFEYAHDAGFESSIVISGNHWDGDHTFPFSTSIEGLWLRFDDIAKLRDQIIQWTSLPLDKLQIECLDSEFELARLPGQKVQIKFGKRSDTVSDSIHPAFSLRFSAGALSGEYFFVTDQSCLNLFAHELSVELSRNKK